MQDGTTLMHSLSSMFFLDIPFHLVQEPFPTGTIPHVYQDHYCLDVQTFEQLCIFTALTSVVPTEITVAVAN